MPSKLRRINLTVPDDLYEAIKRYATANGMQANSVACLSLIQRALASFDDGQTFDILVIEKVAREYDNLCKQYQHLEDCVTDLYSLHSAIIVHLLKTDM